MSYFIIFYVQPQFEIMEALRVLLLALLRRNSYLGLDYGLFPLLFPQQGL